ncbi:MULTISPECIES: hypothetical protein [unclassified Novosphingobium]|uniref:hypothetical protein n=1 Tax=unclassified Novosphingobium TaxID=2644732 RepID=UPI001357242F|nr:MULTISPECIES: hypothetical protein [unclassified Novosphingobium]
MKDINLTSAEVRQSIVSSPKLIGIGRAILKWKKRMIQFEALIFRSIHNGCVPIPPDQRISARALFKNETQLDE